MASKAQLISYKWGDIFTRVDKNGIVTWKTNEQYTDAEIDAIRPEFDSYLLDVQAQQLLEEEKAKADLIKQESLNNLTVTTTSGKVFYADTEARIDLQAAIDASYVKGLTSTMWKLAEEFQGSRIVSVTLEEIREASALALESKATIVGVS